jgi:hypothetical protein
MMEYKHSSDSLFVFIVFIQRQINVLRTTVKSRNEMQWCIFFLFFCRFLCLHNAVKHMYVILRQIRYPYAVIQDNFM